MTTTEKDPRDVLRDMMEDKKERHRKFHEDRRRERQLSPEEREEREEQMKKRQEEYRLWWEQNREEDRKKHQVNPLLEYSAKIYGIVPDYERSFEENLEEEDDNFEARFELSHEVRVDDDILYSMPEKPEGVTKTRWLKEVRQKRK